jgi:o-succinylbenzoate synthase
MLQASLHKQVFEFAFSARTSRGPMKDKTSWFIKLWDDSNQEIFGIGECGPLPGLSIELNEELEGKLKAIVEDINKMSLHLPKHRENSLPSLRNFFSSNQLDVSFSSVVFAFETAWLDLLHGGKRIIFQNGFMDQTPIPINALVWMGGLDFMLQQVEIKIRDGYRCVKLKVGGLDFEKECDILNYIRRKYFREKIEIRLDANGAFKKDEALDKINSLKRFDIHSIEQPIKQGLPEMAELCAKSPIPIALDEELIGVSSPVEKEKLLNKLNPTFIILKPTLHGGLQSCDEWIQLATKKNIGWWITSALESNIGLNAIAQFTSEYPTSITHGLGTGQIYTNNIPSPLLAEKGKLVLRSDEQWDLNSLFPKDPTESDLL